MYIRAFQPGDEPALWEVFFSAIHQTAAAHYTPAQINAWAPPAPDSIGWAKRMCGIRPFVAVDQGAIIGYADLQHDGYIDHFFVAPAVGRQGVGSALMRHIHQQARSRGIPLLYAHVSLTARPFFERWGFQVERAQIVSVRGEEFQNFRMSKALPQERPSDMIDILSDIQEQPQRLRAALAAHLASDSPLEAAVRALKRDMPRRIILTGMGSSLVACYPAFLRLLAAGHAATWIDLSELLHWGGSRIGSGTLLILVSQSGETVEAVRLLERFSIAGPLLAVTNASASTLAGRATYVVPIGAGPEQTVATKSYAASLLVLSLLAERLLDTPAAELAAALSDTIEAVERLCAAGPEQIARLSASWLAPGPITLVGRGPSFATALAGGLLLKETAKIPAEGLSSAQFRHGPLEIAGPGHRAIVCVEPGPTRPLDLRLAEELVAYGSQALLLGDVAAAEAGGAEVVELPSVTLAPLAQIVPLQLLARAIALGRGIEPGSFYHGSKVTTAE